ncbi:MAG: hypothetical protein ACI9YE_000615 [Psychroserpens sp.]
MTNFSDFDDVVKEAQQELTRIKTKESNTNSSVQPQN